MRNLIIVTFIIISTAMGQEKSSMDVTTINPDNDTYNLDQKMSINMEDSDIKNVLSKSQGSSNPHNVVKATFDALLNLRSPLMISRQRGISLDKVFKG